MLIGMLDPPTHNRPFADKRDKVGMDVVPVVRGLIFGGAYIRDFTVLRSLGKMYWRILFP